MVVVPFKAEHFKKIDLQDAQAKMRSVFDDNMLLAVEMMHSFSVLLNDEVIAIFGACEKNNGDGIVWVMLSKKACKHMIALTRLGLRFLRTLNFSRIEADVDCEFTQGHRWAQLAGFVLEKESVRAYRHDGGLSAIYARYS